MKNTLFPIVCLICLLAIGSYSMPPARAEESQPDPIIDLTVKDEPLADVLDTLSQKTGYTFTLSPQWQDLPVSATIVHLPLEQGLKRLLKSLNYTIVWEADKAVTITVFGKAAPGGGGGISYSAPPQPEPQEGERFIEPEETPTEPGEETGEEAVDPQEDAPAPQDE